MKEEPTISDELRQLFPKLCRPKKLHECRLCREIIQTGEPCCRWSGLIPGDGLFTSHAHPECYQLTIDRKWDQIDWEACCPGDIDRPEPQTQGVAK